MKIEHPRPRVVVSRCLGFAACRYDGDILPERFLDRLRPFVEYVTVCPEVEIGLGIPRDPVRLVTRGAVRRLVQPATGRDLTRSMQTFGARFLDGLRDVDGFILKSRSPSCALRDAKHYATAASDEPRGRTSGLFGTAVLRRFGGVAVEDETRLLDLDLREQFLRRLFALGRLRALRANPSMTRLAAFHAAHRLMLMACGERPIRLLGRIVANPGRRRAGQVLARYERTFRRAIGGPAGRGPMGRTLKHVFGLLSDRLSGRERRRFMNALERYRKGRCPATGPLALLRSWVERLGEDRLRREVFFDPFPEALVAFIASRKERQRRWP